MKYLSILLLFCISLTACKDNRNELILGRWEYQTAEIKIDSKKDTVKTNQMAAFVDQLNFQTSDLVFKKDNLFEIAQDTSITDKGKFEIKSKILTMQYGEGAKAEYDDFIIVSLNDSIMNLKNANHLVITYKKKKK